MANKYEKVTELALRKGFYFSSAEIYPSATAGFYEYGPLGTALKRKFVKIWRQMIVKKDDMLELDGSTVLPGTVFEHSGHFKNFVDPVVECKKCKKIHRADKLIEEATKKHTPEALSLKEFDKLLKKYKVKCPCGGKLGKVNKFNMMFSFTVGPRKSEKVALRPETCQNIFLDFARIFKVSRAKLPIGIAQVGRAYRNEISPRQSLIRTREFSQAEVEVFFNPKKANKCPKFDEIKNYKLKLLRLGKKKVQKIKAVDAVKKKIVTSKLSAYYLALLQKFYEEVGLTDFRFREVSKDERAFYAKETWDFEIKTSVGWIECVACNYRTDHDLISHAKGSKQKLEVMDENEKVLPHVFELSMGIDRSLYCLLEHAFAEETVRGQKRVVLKLNQKLSPYFIAVFPLIKKDKLPAKAKKVIQLLGTCWDIFYDESGSIGKRYRRMDEIGTPFCITVDHQTLEDNTVTVRDRDTMKQKRIKLDKLCNFFLK
ncbi:glycine--tRNA ligase [Candidatus Woesearchaeota archaeon]|nr:glycine--tRNA ligase [Candidatus Woesearchaeota archaeon]